MVRLHTFFRSKPNDIVILDLFQDILLLHHFIPMKSPFIEYLIKEMLFLVLIIEMSVRETAGMSVSIGGSIRLILIE